MANIMVRRNNGGQQVGPVASEWDPFRLMRELSGWDPFREIMPMGTSGGMVPSFAPAFEVKETKDGYHFTADIPGVKEKDLDITAVGNRLTVSGKREAEQEEKNDTFFLYERSYGSFTRSFTLPEGADAEHIRAELKDGILLLMVPKKPDQMPKKITIKTGEKSKS